MGTAIDTKRFEQIGGQLVERPWINSRRSEIRTKAVAQLARWAKKLNLGVHVELSIKQSDAAQSDWMTPDITVTEAAEEAKIAGGFLIPPVHLVIEVLSEFESTDAMLEKAGRYLDWGVEHVWVVIPHREFGLTFSQEHGKDSSMNWDYLIVPGERAFWLMLPELFA
jgi:Uma2 family endonuclease